MDMAQQHLNDHHYFNASYLLIHYMIYIYIYTYICMRFSFCWFKDCSHFRVGVAALAILGSRRGRQSRWRKGSV